MPAAIEPSVAPLEKIKHQNNPPEPPEDMDNGDDDGEPVRWATVATFWQPAAAHIARAKLESEGIDCFIVDENLVATDWLYANAVGGIKLQVPEELLERARQSLQPVEVADGPKRVDSDEPLFDGQDRCPQCGSDDIRAQLFSRKLAVWSILFLSFPLPLFKPGLHCRDCGFEWKVGHH